MSREPIFAALFTRLQTVAGLAYSSRIFTGWDDTSAIEQPALFLLKGDERAVIQRPLPPKWELEAKVLLLARTVESDPTIAPGTVLNNLLDGVMAVLARQGNEPPDASPSFSPNPDMTAWTTLGGLCSSVQVRGDIVVDEGALGSQAAAVIPLVIITAG